MTKKAEEFFHNKENKWNCCQAVLKRFQKEIDLTDEEIEALYRPCGGGKAEGGLCGALYAGELLMKKNNLPSIKEDFNKIAGGITCQVLKKELRFPCVESVRLAEKLVEERIKEKEKQ